MKTQQTNKLFSLFLLVIFLITLLVFYTGCQKGSTTISTLNIVYRDIEPDTIVSNGVYHLDLNNDGIAEFDVRAGSKNGRCPPGVYPPAQPNVSFVEIVSFDSNSFGDTTLGTGTAKLPVPFSSGREINKDMIVVWRGTNIGTLGLYNSCSTDYGLWLLDTDQYLPLRLATGSSVYFGWVRINIHLSFSGSIPSFHFTIKDYAYNSIANQPILAGQTK